jgi:hypothetical protein
VADLQASVEALALAVAARVPVLLWGPPGSGKTSVVRSLAAAMGWPCETVIASIREPSDFAGLPVVAPTGSQVDFAPPRWARRLAESSAGILFLDEISTAPPAVQAALLRVVLERTVGDLPLPEGVAVVAAANPPEQAADGWDLSPPLANRFCHLEWSVDARVVAAGFVGGFPPVTVPELPDNWATGRAAAAAGAVAGFLVARPGLACVVPSDASTAGRGWPSPRSWEMLSKLLAAAKACGSSQEVVAALVLGCVGEGAGLEFLSWYDELDLPDPEAVLADPANFTVPERGDRVLAALSAVCAVVIADLTVERWLAGWKVLGRAAATAPDVAAIAARSLTRNRPPGSPVPPEVHLFSGLLADAGLA